MSGQFDSELYRVLVLDLDDFCNSLEVLPLSIDEVLLLFIEALYVDVDSVVLR
jgi:hypothetical protein